MASNVARFEYRPERARRFGTFQLSVYSGLGAESLQPSHAFDLTSELRPIDKDGSVTVRIHYDHRVMDGANVARALERFERILNGEITAELEGLAFGRDVTAAAGSGPAR